MIVLLISYLLNFGDFYPREAILPDKIIYFYKESKGKRKRSKLKSTFIPISHKKVKKSRKDYSTRDKMK